MNMTSIKNLARYVCKNSVGPIVRQPWVEGYIKKAFQTLTQEISTTPFEQRRTLLFRLRRYQSLLTLCYPHPYNKKATLPSGIHLTVDVADIIGLSLYMNAPVPDIVELEIVRALTPQNGTFFDVGANIGLYSILAGISAGPNGHIHSFEPVSTTYNTLSQNLSLNIPSCSTSSHMALGNTIGDIDIYASEQSGLSSILNNQKNRVLRVEKVPISTLDEYCRARTIESIDFLKIDVEGFEHEVFLGSKDTLQRADPVILVELIEEHLNTAGSSTAQVVGMLSALDFSGWVIDRNRHMLSPITLTPLPKRKGVNYIFARKTNPHFNQLRTWEHTAITTKVTL
jgi:FkbM family methyltransferase